MLTHQVCHALDQYTGFTGTGASYHEQVTRRRGDRFHLWGIELHRRSVFGFAEKVSAIALQMIRIHLVI